MADKQRFKIVEIPGVHEQYANQFVSGGFDGSAVAVTLGALRIMPEKMGDAPKDGVLPSVYVTTRLMLSVPCALDMIKQLQGMLDQIGLKVQPGGQDNAPAPKPADGGSINNGS